MPTRPNGSSASCFAFLQYAPRVMVIDKLLWRCQSRDRAGVEHRQSPNLNNRAEGRTNPGNDENGRCSDSNQHAMRIEALFTSPSRLDPPPRARLSSGVASLDAMFGGGLAAATMPELVGPSGAGKTTVGPQSPSHFGSGEYSGELGWL